MTTTKKPTKPDLTVVGKGGQSRKRPGGNRTRAVAAEQKRLDDEARDAEVWAMKNEGKTLAQIADHFGWASPNSASLAVKRHVQRTPRPDVEDTRLTELTRLNAMAAGLMSDFEAATNPDDRAKIVTAYVRVSTRIAALMGADEPKRAELTGRDGGPIMIADEEDARGWMEAIRTSMDRRLQAVP